MRSATLTTLASLTTLATLAILTLLDTLPAAAEVYQAKSGAIKSLSWEAPAGGADSFEYYFLQMENAGIYGRGQVPAPVTTIRFRTPGTYSLWVRACNGADAARVCGSWAQSTDPAFGTVNGAPAPWLIKVTP
jgi:hypothetical protein